VAIFSELSDLAREMHSDVLSDESVTYQYKSHASQTWTTLAGVVELHEVIEFRKSPSGGTNRINLLPIRVAEDQFTSRPIIGGLIQITVNNQASTLQIESMKQYRSGRHELKLQRTSINQITRPKYTN
jgi:uncharacterized protein YbbK (DUF523 family)